MHIKQAVLFCGGKGTRLFPITEFYQKVMIPFGKHKIPLLQSVIEYLKEYNINDILALVGYRHNLIKRYFKNGENFEINIKYIVDSPNFSGTGGALYNARNRITDDNFVLYYSDIITDLPINKLCEYHLINNATATLWLDPSWNFENGYISAIDDNVIDINYSLNNILVNTGIACFNKNIFKYIEMFIKTTGKTNIDLSKDILPLLLKNDDLFAYIEKFNWNDIGSIDRLVKK